MEGRNTKFEAYLKENLDKYRGVYVPVRANLLQRLLVQELNCNKIHPNPDDEFCKPEIGPSYEIISRYEEVIRAARMRGDNKPYKEPVIVEKIRPDGYMLLNGHHRWAAAMRMGMKKIPVKVVNMTTESDIHRILNKTTNTKRVTLDLDEVVFAPDGEEGSAEKPLRWPLKKIFRERLRLGMPALFFFLRSHGYDIWVYTAKYYSPEYLHKLFWLYGAHIDGLETGTGRKRRLDAAIRKKLDQMIDKQYPTTIHVDNHAAVRIDSQTKAFEEFPLSGDARTWSQEVMDIIGKLDKPVI